MRPLPKLLLTTAAAAAALAPTAAADTPLVDAPGAKALAGAGGWLVWSAPTPEGQFRLTVRAPDGTVSQPAIPAFTRPVPVGVGSNTQYGSAKRVVAVYPRDGDVRVLDLERGTDRRYDQVSSRATETLAAINNGQVVTVRSTGEGKGLYVRSNAGRTRRLTSTVPSQVAMAYSRVATVEGTGADQRVVIRRLSGRGRPMVVRKGLTGVSSLWLTRYRAGFATTTAQGTRLVATRRFAGSGGPYTLTTLTDPWTSTSALSGIVTNGSEPTTFLDDGGVKRFSPIPFHGR
ncbi:hypothetical protein [Conexibacter sp. SYSU D00693]|uniref:hypothetical protein n=1 Tax=Conexibacter sp. SYSU D00693 TaxID=2812560 RepID=UPI00196A68D4|nr:hypothetical protein [Conexibacter sp. SYSU D00693]